MSRTAMLRRQHDAAEEMVARLIRSLQVYSGPRDAYRLSLDFAKLNGLLRIHLAQEDLSLYPQLIASGNAEASRIAALYQKEMGSLAGQLDHFMRRWTGSSAIADDFDEFKRESLSLFRALGERIRRENDVLYPLADRTMIDAAA